MSHAQCMLMRSYLHTLLPLYIVRPHINNLAIILYRAPHPYDASQGDNLRHIVTNNRVTL